jgi:sialate O-acetylesterase
VEVGQRLSLWAYAKAYGMKDIVYSGPLYKKMKIEKDKIRIYFNYTGSGLVSRGGPPTHFEISGKDRIFVKADAVIDGDTILVSSDSVKEPVAVRFAWHDTAEPNLFNEEGLPASSFRTDDWPGPTYGIK